MAELAKEPATYEDLYSIPENMIGEIIDGEFITSPPAFSQTHACGIHIR
ncbi:MAG: hypothetical protein AB2L11_05990 [Syntrophobacteraceae bacterium]